MSAPVSAPVTAPMMAPLVPRAPRVLAVCNRKGGAGKTTTALNLAAELAALGRRVLLLDLDSQGHCAVGLGHVVAPGAPTAHRIFTDPTARLMDAVCATTVAGLMLAPADQMFEHGSGRCATLRLAGALADPELAGAFDVVVLDTAPSFDALLLGALSAAHWVLVPYLPHPLSFEGVRQLMRVLFKVMSDHNPDLKLMGFLPIGAAANIRQHRSVTADIARQFGAHRVLARIRNDIRLAEAFAVGKPVRTYAPRSRGARDFADLAAALAPLLV